MTYRVILEVIYPVVVEAENQEEAIDLALDECPYDNADEVEPVVEEVAKCLDLQKHRKKKYIKQYEECMREKYGGILAEENNRLAKHILELQKDKGRLVDENKDIQHRLDVAQGFLDRDKEYNRLLDVINNQDVKITDLERQIEKLKADLNEAIEDANRWEETETFSVLNRIYNDNFEVITSVSN